jgi:hypothetical protein
MRHRDVPATRSDRLCASAKAVGERVPERDLVGVQGQGRPRRLPRILARGKPGGDDGRGLPGEARAARRRTGRTRQPAPAGRSGSAAPGRPGRSSRPTPAGWPAGPGPARCRSRTARSRPDTPGRPAPAAAARRPADPARPTPARRRNRPAAAAPAARPGPGQEHLPGPRVGEAGGEQRETALVAADDAEPLNASKPDPDVIDHGLNSTGPPRQTGLSPSARPEASRAGVQPAGWLLTTANAETTASCSLTAGQARSCSGDQPAGAARAAPPLRPAPFSGTTASALRPSTLLAACTATGWPNTPRVVQWP